MTATGRITFKSCVEAAGQRAFETILGYLSGGRTNSHCDNLSKHIVSLIFNPILVILVLHLLLDPLTSIAVVTTWHTLSTARQVHVL